MGKKGDWDDGFLTMQGTAVEVGNEVLCYYSGNRIGHSASRETDRRKIGLAKIKRDRFASITAKKRGMVEVFHGHRYADNGQQLKVNAKTGGNGWIRAEVCQGAGKKTTVIPGFAKGDCRPIRGDGVELTVRWKDKSWGNLATDVPLVVRFFMENAQLFAYETG